MSTYRYGPEWKAAVDRSGEDWRAYCEALDWLKRYAREAEVVGRRVAWDAMQDRLAETGARQDRLREDILLVGKHEMERIRADLETALAPAAVS